MIIDKNICMGDNFLCKPQKESKQNVFLTHVCVVVAVVRLQE